MQWFRMYAEAVDDEKLRLLAFEDRWHFVALLCLKAQGVLNEADDALRRRKIGIKLGLDSVELETVMKRLETVGLVSSVWEPSNWNKRQYLSDSSTKRVQAFRKRSRNVSVTPSDTDTDTDTDTEKKKSKSKRERLPRSSRAPKDFQPDVQLAVSRIPDLDVATEVQKFRDWEFKTPRSDWSAVWRTWIENARESGRYARKPKGEVMMFAGRPVEWQ